MCFILHKIAKTFIWYLLSLSSTTFCPNVSDLDVVKWVKGHLVYQRKQLFEGDKISMFVKCTTFTGLFKIMIPSEIFEDFSYTLFWRKILAYVITHFLFLNAESYVRFVCFSNSVCGAIWNNVIVNWNCN